MKHLVLLFAAIAPLAAGAQSYSMSTLQDLPSVAVTVRAITPDGVRFGVVEATLVKNVSDVLAAAGVKVVPPAEAADASDLPAVEITALVSKLSATGHIYTLRLALTEVVVLKRKTKNLIDLPAVTWEKEAQGYTSSPDRIIGSAITLAERFSTEWKEAN